MPLVKIDQIFSQLRKLLLLSLPNRCLLCHQHMRYGSSGICAVCLKTALYQQPVCLGCGRSMVSLMKYCGACMKHQPLPVVAPASYHSGLGSLIAAIKYQSQLAPLKVLTQALANRIRELETEGIIRLPQALLPVPMHADRLKQRGFNQAYLIGELLSQMLDLPLAQDILSRSRATIPQAGLDGKTRRHNLKGAFCLNTTQPWQRLAIIDDVVTTGSTANEIARTLGQYVDIQVWCLARAEAPGLLD